MALTQNNLIHFALLDGDPSTHSSVRRAIEGYEWTMTSYTDGKNALRDLLTVQPDVLLMEASMQGTLNIKGNRKLTELLPCMAVLAISSRADYKTVRRTLESGVHGYLVKPLQPENLVTAISRAAQGGKVLCEKAQEAVCSIFHSEGKQLAQPHLTRRQEQIIQLLAKDLSDKEIAQRLGMAHRTVHAHLNQIYKKIGAHSRSEAVVIRKMGGSSITRDQLVRFF